MKNMKKLLLSALLLTFCFIIYLFFKFEPWPEKYLYLFDKREDFFEISKFKKNCSISDFGATSGGQIKNTEAFQQAISTCFQAGGGNVIVPKGSWLTGAIHLQSNINLKLEEGAEVIFSTDPADYLPTVLTRFEGIELFNYSPFIYAKDAENVSITGTGKLIGQGNAWQKWNKRQEDSFIELYKLAEEKKNPTERIFGSEEDALRPSFVQFYNCKNISLEDFSIQDGPMWTIHMVFSENITAQNIHISSFGHNSDGFVIDSSKNVLLNKIEVASGDDAISIKSGLESDIWNKNIPSENVIIKNSIINAGHGGVAIGSEMSGGIKNIVIKQNYFAHVDWALRIKSIPGRGGYVEDVFAKNLKLRDVNQVLAVDLQYPAPTMLPSNQDAIPSVKNITLENIRGTDVEEFVYLRGLPNSQLQNITLKNIHVKSKGMSEIINSEDVLFENVSTDNVKDKELFIENSRNITFYKSKLCQKNASNCISIDGKDNDKIHFKQSNVSIENIDASSSVSKKSIKITN